MLVVTLTDNGMNPVRVKICGLTSVEDALHVVTAGADAIGLVFYPPSPRHVDVAQAAAIARAVGPFVTVVGLFVDPDAEMVEQVLAQVDLHVLQFHGDEPEVFCAQFNRPYLKALRMKPDVDVAQTLADYPSASAVLLDAYSPGIPGGTGETFDWSRVPASSQVPVVLAGGLNPENISDAVAAVSVYGVDVSGGVESSPGKKDTDKVAAFIRRAKGGE